MQGFITALEFLTRVRFSSSTEWRAEDFGRSVAFFPLIGLLLGVVLAGVNFALAEFNIADFLRGVLLLVAELFFAGGLMYDGFMDTCDGVFSARDRKRMLEIMKDSHVGANAVLGLVVLLLLKISLFLSFPATTLSYVLPGAYTLSRSLMTVNVILYPYPRESGIGKMFKDSVKTWYIVPAVLVSGCLCWQLGLNYCYGGIICGAVTSFAALFLVKQLGGLTGDTYGFLTEIAFAVFMFAVYIVNGLPY